MSDLNQVAIEVQTAIEELIMEVQVQPEGIIVLGCSSSEVIGNHIGKGSSAEAGQIIVETILKATKKHNLYLAVQGCEHINRSLVVERALALAHCLEIVSVAPALNAGGSAAVAAYSLFDEPVMVEYIIGDAGLDIGDTAIGMHIKHVQIPLRLTIKQIGQAHVTYLKHRPKLIGGARAQY